MNHKKCNCLLSRQVVIIDMTIPMREYIRQILREDDAGGNTAMGPGGDWVPGMIGPYGMTFGSGKDLLNTFVTPFTDAFKTSLSKTKELSRKTGTLIWNSLQTILSSFIPIYGYRYQKIFENEKADIEKIRSQNREVISRIDDSFKGDAAVLFFMSNPGLSIAGLAAKKSPAVAKEIASIMTGGTSDELLAKYFDVKSEGLIREEQQLDANFVTEFNKNPKVSSMMKTAQNAYKRSLSAVYEQAKKVSAIQSLDQLQKDAGKNINIKSGDEQAQNIILSESKKAILEFFMKSLEGQIEPISKGIGKDSQLVKDYEKTILSIKNLIQR